MKLKMKLAVPIAAALAIVAGGAAFAASSGPSTVTNVNSNGVVGYSAVENGNDTYFTDEISQFGLGDPQYSVNNPQIPVNPVLAFLLRPLHEGDWVPFSMPDGVNVAAARIGFCGGTRAYHRSTDAFTTVQELIVPVTATTYDVLAVEGQFENNGGDPCLNSELPHGEAALVLKNIPDADTMRLQLLFDGQHAHNGAGAGHASFIAADLTGITANQVNTPDSVFGDTSEFYEADNGILGANLGDATSSLASTVLPNSTFPNLAAVEAHAVLNGNTIGGAEDRGTFQSGMAWDVVADATQVGGVITGAPGFFSNDHFDNYVAPGVFPVTAG